MPGPRAPGPFVRAWDGFSAFMDLPISTEGPYPDSPEMLGRPTQIVLALFLVIPLPGMLAKGMEYKRVAEADQPFFQALGELAPFIWAALLIGVMFLGYYRDKAIEGRLEKRPSVVSVVITALGCVLTLLFVTVLGLQQLLN